MKTITTPAGTWEVSGDYKRNPNYGIVCYVKVVALIRKKATGEVVEYPTELPLHEGEDTPNDFIWVDGNYSCNCNRGDFFERTKDPEWDDTEYLYDQPEGTDWGPDFEGETERPKNLCSDDNFEVNLKNPVDGKIFYQEFEI